MTSVKYVPSVRSLREVIRRHGLDSLVVLLAVLGVYEVMRPDAGLEVEPVWAASLVVAMALLLIARRRFPFAAPAAIWVLGAGLSFVDGALLTSTFGAYVAGAVAAYLFGNLPDIVRARLGLVIVVAGAAVVVFNSPVRAASDFLTIPATFAIAWLAGLVLRARADQVEAAEERAAAALRERESVARAAVAEERARITRELHDVVAHAMSVMVLQVGAVRHRLPESRSEDRDALRSVEEVGRSALTEMRSLLGAIHEGAAELAPQPGIDQLDELAAHVTGAGLPVSVRREGGPTEAPRALGSSVYRIVQEALTNSLKHAHATRAEVVVRFDPDWLQVDVTDDGVGPTSGDGTGRGIIGISERVKVFGGDMETGPAPGGGFRVQVRLPVGNDRR